jgi:pimeloyl-ACP methyl ester carboxylesterase
LPVPDFTHDGLRFRYALAGPRDGAPIVLVHGFASNYELNWLGTRWQETLAGAGRLVLGLDCRGHGRSDKPHDPSAYARVTMATDTVALLDHLDLAAADYLGYSMGARIGLDVAIGFGDRFGRFVLGGLGEWSRRRRAEVIARRLRGDDSDHDPTARFFYEFASSRPENDLEALACCILGDEPPLATESLGSIRNRVLIVTGDHDPLAAGAGDLAEAIPGGSHVTLAGRNHMNAVPARQFKTAALEFLAAPW